MVIMSVDKVIYRSVLRMARQFDKNVTAKVRDITNSSMCQTAGCCLGERKLCHNSYIRYTRAVTHTASSMIQLHTHLVFS